jgi:hypothetical protein
MDFTLPLTDVRVSTRAFATPGAVFPAAIPPVVQGQPVVAYFSRDVVTLLLAHLLAARAAVVAEMDPESDAVRVQLTSEADVESYEGMRISRPDGRTQHLYGVGAGVWEWTLDGWASAAS